MQSGGQQQRRCGVPPVVQANLAHARLVQEDVPCAPVRLPLYPSAVDMREDRVVLVPHRTGRNAFLALRGLVSSHCVDPLAGNASVRQLR